jgi:hypothetical protein
LGNGEQFAPLEWLADQGCATDAELSDAETLVRAYEDSPERAAMLENLKRLHHRAE